jgi:hypothetical protein
VFVNTSEAIYAMFSLAERLRDRNEDPVLCDRLIEEAKWGLDWVLKTTFHDGFRITAAVMDLWTDGILGDADDVTAEARNSPYENFLAAAAEAIAYRNLACKDPLLAARSLATAQEDWRFADEGMGGRPSGRGSGLQLASAGILASLELFRATGERRYADKALELAPQILNSQQRSFFPDWKVPITGFFYTSPAKDRIQHYDHRGHEQGTIVAMARLCEAFPNHPDWIQWYSVVAFHSEFFLKAGAKFTEPYGMLPASVYRDDEQAQRHDDNSDFFRAQVLNGVELGNHYYLRLFPAWTSPGTRGNFGTLLSATKALSEAAHLRGDLDAAGLAQRQLQWALGRNPFCQSFMYGEGYDYAPQYTAMSGNIVGSLPVGIQTRFDRDVPFCPAANWPNWKEVWVHPVSRWIWLMRDLAGPALIEGECDSALQFRHITSGAIAEIKPDFASGKFRAMLPQGTYEINGSKRMTLLPGGTYRFDPALNFSVSAEAHKDGNMSITVTARGIGKHRFSIRSVNLTGAEGGKDAALSGAGAKTIEWRVRVASEDAPWVAVVIPDGQLDRRKEVIGPLGGR